MEPKKSELIGTAEAAEILEVTPRQALRILSPVGRAWHGRTAAALYYRADVEAIAEARAYSKARKS